MRYKDLEKLLISKGCNIRYCKGSHVMVKYQSALQTLTFTLTRHNSHDRIQEKELNRLVRANIIERT